MHAHTLTHSQTTIVAQGDQLVPLKKGKIDASDNKGTTEIEPLVALHQTPGVTNARGGAERCRPSPPDRTQSDPHPGRWEGRARYKPQLVALRRALSSLDDNRCRFPDLRGPPAGVTHNCPNSHSLKGQGRDSLTARRPQAVLPQ